MIIEIYSKNFALIHTIEHATGSIPRAGETITLEQEPFETQGVSELLVHDVTYILKNDQLTPLIKCHGSNGSVNRRIVLEENGWL